MVYDQVSARIVVFGGRGESARLDDTWLWDGSTWVELSPPRAPPPRDDLAMVYDAARRRVVMFGGSSGDTWGDDLNDTWFFDLASPEDPEEACYTGFDGDGDGDIGCADSDCAGACAHCGDAACSPIEGCRLCPADCGACAPVCGDFLCDPDESCTTCASDCPCP
jgi:hypothetical protein